MGLRKKISGHELARKMVRDWNDDTLLNREPHELAYAFGISRTEADQIIKAERYRRDL